MKAAMEGRWGRRSALRSAIAWIALILAYVGALSFYKESLLNRFAEQGLAKVQTRHSKILSLFQSSFFFFYEDQFLPGIRSSLDSREDGDTKRARPFLERVFIISRSAEGAGSVVFDSRFPDGRLPSEKAKEITAQVPKEYFEALQGSAATDSGDPRIYRGGSSLQILMPSGQYGIVYVLDSSWIRLRILLTLVFGVLLLVAARWVFRGERLRRFRATFVHVWHRFWRLRARLLFAIILMNGITATIVFFSLTTLQTRELTNRIEKESLLFSHFATAEIVSNFTDYFYFYYTDRFVPEMKRIIASNEKLLGIRIVSTRTGAVLFDSEQAVMGGGGPAQLRMLEDRADFPEEVRQQLQTQRQVGRNVNRGGERLLSVINTYLNENEEPLFWVEYLFTFSSLETSIQAMRERLLLDLIPAVALGLLIGAIFAQLIISPIRRLMAALQKVTSGDYDAAVDIRNTDEFGELGSAFNTMTSELRKKKELRKYLSDSTYRQIMAAPDSPGGLKLGGSRVAATVLFSDIRNFVGHCEMLEAEEVTAMLNEYFAEMVEVVYKHGGEIDKFIGDAFLAVFYAEEDAKTIRKTAESASSSPTVAGSALRAIYCGLEMRERLAEFNERRKANNKLPLEIGVGITHGEIISGPIGAKDRMDFTVIGDVVNLANRIEKLSKGGKHTKIVFSNHVEEKIRGLLDYEELTREKIRGKEEEVHVFELIGVRDLQVLMGNLRGSDLPLRRRSVELLGQTRNEEALPHLIELIRDKDELTQLNAVVAVSKVAPRDHVRALDALFEALWSRVSEKVASAIVSAIGKVCGSERILDLAPLLDSDEERIVANVVEAIGQIRSPKASDLLLPKLSSLNNRVKANAAMALFAAGHLEVIDTLKPMLMHSDPLMRSSAAFAIGELTLIAAQKQLADRWKEDPQQVRMFLAEIQECVPMLVSLLKDSSSMVKRQAVIALGKIRDKSAVLPIIDMIDPRSADAKELIQDVSQALNSIGSHGLVREVVAKLSQ